MTTGTLKEKLQTGTPGQKKRPNLSIYIKTTVGGHINRLSGLPTLEHAT